MPTSPRPRKDKEVRARVSADLKYKIQLLAALRPESESESLVVREALVAYVARPDVKLLLEEAERRAARLPGGAGHG